MRRGWHLFLILAALIAGGSFYIGCRVQKFYDLPPDDKKGKTDQWQPPELVKGMHQVVVKFGDAFAIYEVKDLTNPVPFEVRVPIMYSGGQFLSYHPFSSHVKDNRLYIDVEIATKTKPIQIKGGKIIDLPEGWQANMNSNVIEIVSSEVIPVFQEFYAGTNQFTIKGTLRSGDMIFYLDGRNMVRPVYFQSYLEGETPDRILPDQYFAYPVSEFPGVLYNK